MSEWTIKDGTGNSYRAKVDENHRLRTSAVTVSPLVAFPGHAYAVYTGHNVEVADTTESLCVFTNTSFTKAVYIDKVLLTTDATGISNIEFFFDATVTSGGTSKPKLNFDRSSTNVSEVIVMDNGNNDLVMSIDSALEFIGCKLGNGQQSFDLDFEGAIRLRTNNSFGINVKSTSVGDRIRAMIYFHEEDAG